jgi:hypothetical protein
MNKLELHAKNCLTQLVTHVFAHQSGLIGGLTYSELAFRIGRLNSSGEGHGHGMGQVLGVMGHMLQGLEGQWGESIPHIQSLVVNKAGPDSGLPDDGIKEFWPDYPHMTRLEKRNRMRVEHQKVMVFGSRWNDVLQKLELQPVFAKIATPHFGKGGESVDHKVLKEYVRHHPELVGAASHWESFTEYPLPSMDEIDVVFKCDDACIAVEVKSALSDAYPLDYERGLYQTIKYGALLSAMARDDRYGIPPNIKSILLLASRLPEQYRNLSTKLSITLIENVKVEK